VLQPLLARPHPTAHGMFQIIAGERRWRAAQAAGLHEVPVLVRALSDTEAMAAALVENLQRQDLDAIEEAEGYERLSSEFDLSQDDLAKLVGKSRSHVANCVRLLSLPMDIRAHIQAGDLSAGHGRVLLGHKNAGALARTIIARDLNVRQAEALVAAPKAAKPKPEPDAERRALEHDLSQALGLTVKVDFNGAGGAIRIAYKSLDQLDALIARLTR
jgi:ParB family chromosome partitioning protein